VLRHAVLANPVWLLDDARQLFANACHFGLDVEGAPGIVYTLDWQNEPVVGHRLHWTHCEAAGAAAELLQRTGEQQY
ncbi:AGE family epimerase/isomerase, partial [Pseudomonas syringae group genomosp. 7]|uniref:AGE family epimerase/isomerase n=1 Tax=Pseudomonas syringae group genomosp. 7 TaxID=251699 RepID=UPI00376F9DB7